MLFWLVQTGEELPLDGSSTRLLRTAVLAEELCNRGHEVIFINASFNHQQKRQRTKKTTIIAKDPSRGCNYDTVLLAGRAYRKNVSVRRFFSHVENAAAFDAIAPSLPRPHAILCGFPPIELAERAVIFAQRNEIPCAIDCRDMWPEVIEQRLPSLLQPLLRIAFTQFYRKRKRAMAVATAITGITSPFVAWGLSCAGRPKNNLDRPFHLSVSPAAISTEDSTAAIAFWDSKLGPRHKNKQAPITGCFAGTFASRTDLRTIVDGANLLNAEQRKSIRIVLCGLGDIHDDLSELAKGNDAIVLAGWRNAAEIGELMRRSDFGILPYPNTPDFLASFPNKVGEYLLSGLPIMTALAGVTGNLLDFEGLALRYNEGDAESAHACFERLIGKRTSQDLSSKARAVGAQHFDPHTIYPEFADWLENLACSESI